MAKRQKLNLQLPLELYCEWFSFLPLKASVELVTLNGSLSELCGPKVKEQKLWRYCNDQLQPLLKELHNPAQYLEELPKLPEQDELIEHTQQTVIESHNNSLKGSDEMLLSNDLTTCPAEKIDQCLAAMKEMKEDISSLIMYGGRWHENRVQLFNLTKRVLTVPKIGEDDEEWKKFPKKIQPRIYEAYLRQLSAWKAEVESAEREYHKSKHSQKLEELDAQLQNRIDTLAKILESREEENVA